MSEEEITFPLNEDGSVNVESEEFKAREAKIVEANSLLFTLDSASLKIQEEDRKYLLGRVLTVVDAITIEPQQRKAIKDLIHSAVEEFKKREQRLACEKFERFSEMLAGKENAMSMVDNPWEKNRLPSLV